MQYQPTLWLLEEAKSDLVGKIDDDILLPEGWIEQIAPLIRAEPRFGMLGCWIFMPEDWNEAAAARKIIELGGVRVLQSMAIAGQSFLARRNLLQKYVLPPGQTYGFPIDQGQMTEDGFINGCPLPLLLAHNMDDPRSPHCLMNRPGGMGEQAALTARKLGFKTPEAYVAWIAADARRGLAEPVALQLKRRRRERDRSLYGRARRKLARMIGKIPTWLLKGAGT